MTEIDKKYKELGRANNWVGSPLHEERELSNGRGRYRTFQNSDGLVTSIFSTPEKGAYETHGVIESKWAELGKEHSDLGFPISDEQFYEEDGVIKGRISYFERGAVIWLEKWNEIVVLKLDHKKYWASSSNLSLQNLQKILNLMNKKPSGRTGLYVGIDFGTTKTMVSKYDHSVQKPLILGVGADNEISTTIYTPENGEDPLFGEDADIEGEEDGVNHVRCFKMKLGLKSYRHNGKSAKDLTALFLRHVRRLLEDELLHEKVASAVITVPAIFGPKPRGRLEAAAREAGFHDVTLLKEPVAAAMAYCAENKSVSVGKSFMVVDWGGGTLDIAVVKHDDDGTIEMFDSFVVGRNDLGGEIFDDELWIVISNLLTASNSPSLDDQPDELWGRYRRMVRKFKERLSKKKEIKAFFTFESGTLGRTHVQREDLEDAVRKHVDAGAKLVEELCQKARKNDLDIDFILLVGGTSRMPIVKDVISKATGLECKQWITGKAAVAMGAAIKAHELWGAGGESEPEDEPQESSVDWMSLIHDGNAEEALAQITSSLCENPSNEALDAWIVAADHCGVGVVKKSKTKICDQLSGQDWCVAIEMLYHCQFRIDKDAPREVSLRVDNQSELNELSYPMAMANYLFHRNRYADDEFSPGADELLRIFPQSSFFQWECESNLKKMKSAKGNMSRPETLLNSIDSGKLRLYFDQLKDLNPLRGSFIEMREVFEILYKNDLCGYSIDIEHQEMIKTLHNEMRLIAKSSSYSVMGEIMSQTISSEYMDAIKIFNNKIAALQRQALDFLEVGDCLLFNQNEGLREVALSDSYFIENYTDVLNVWNEQEVWGGLENKYKTRGEYLVIVFPHVSERGRSLLEKITMHSLMATTPFYQSLPSIVIGHGVDKTMKMLGFIWRK